MLSRFTEAERARIGVHTGPGADQDSAHSLDVDYAELLPQLFRLTVGNFYLQLASEAGPDRVLGIVGFAPFADDASTSRDTAFAKIRARVQGTALAAEQLGA